MALSSESVTRFPQGNNVHEGASLGDRPMLPSGEKFAVSALARTEMGAHIANVFRMDPKARIEFRGNENILDQLTDAQGFTLQIHDPGVLGRLRGQSPALKLASLLPTDDAGSLIRLVQNGDARMATLRCIKPPNDLVRALAQSTGLTGDAQAAIEARTVNGEYEVGATEGEATHGPWNNLPSQAVFLIPHVGKGGLDANLHEIKRLNIALHESSTTVEPVLAKEQLITEVLRGKNSDAAKLLAVMGVASAASFLGMGATDNPEMQTLIKFVTSVGYDMAFIGMGTLPNAPGDNIFEKARHVFKNMPRDEKALRLAVMASNGVSAALGTYHPEDRIARMAYIATPTLGALAQSAITAGAEYRIVPKEAKPKKLLEKLRMVGNIFRRQNGDNPAAAASIATAIILGTGAAAIQGGTELPPDLRNALDIWASGGMGDLSQTMATLALMMEARRHGAQAELRTKSKQFVERHFGALSLTHVKNHEPINIFSSR